MEKLGPFCKHCSHNFKLHQQNSLNLWFCDGEDEFGEYCTCNYFEPKSALSTDGNEIELPYDSESYRWN